MLVDIERNNCPIQKGRTVAASSAFRQWME
jgi:hypothetical protein